MKIKATKVCRQCKQELPNTVDYFYPANYVDKLDKLCKTCRSNFIFGLLDGQDSGRTKRCPHCNITYPASVKYFYFDQYSNSGLSSWCVDCINNRNAEKYWKVKQNRYFLAAERREQRHIGEMPRKRNRFKRIKIEEYQVRKIVPLSIIYIESNVQIFLLGMASDMGCLLVQNKPIFYVSNLLISKRLDELFRWVYNRETSVKDSYMKDIFLLREGQYVTVIDRYGQELLTGTVTDIFDNSDGTFRSVELNIRRKNPFIITNLYANDRGLDFQIHEIVEER